MIQNRIYSFHYHCNFFFMTLLVVHLDKYLQYSVNIIISEETEFFKRTVLFFVVYIVVYIVCNNNDKVTREII